VAEHAWRNDDAALDARRSFAHRRDAAGAVDRVQRCCAVDDASDKQAMPEPSGHVVGDTGRKDAGGQVDQPRRLPVRGDANYTRRRTGIQDECIVLRERATRACQRAARDERNVRLACRATVPRRGERARNAARANEKEPRVRRNDEPAVNARSGDVHDPRQMRRRPPTRNPACERERRQRRASCCKNGPSSHPASVGQGLWGALIATRLHG